MKVYLGYECYYNYCDVFESVVKVFDDEVKALVWKEEFTATETDWRIYREIEVE
jgi:hypothetical protein